MAPPRLLLAAAVLYGGWLTARDYATTHNAEGSAGVAHGSVDADAKDAPVSAGAAGSTPVVPAVEIEDATAGVVDTPDLPGFGTERQTLRYSFCVSWGFRAEFGRQKAFLGAVFPELNIVGETAQPGPVASAVSTVLSYAMYGALAWLIAGPGLFRALGTTEPPVLAKLRENKVALIGAYFALNMLQSKLAATGAFEVHLGDKLLASKLATGRAPVAEEVARAIAAAEPSLVATADPVWAAELGLLQL